MLREVAERAQRRRWLALERVGDGYSWRVTAWWAGCRDEGARRKPRAREAEGRAEGRPPGALRTVSFRTVVVDEAVGVDAHPSRSGVAAATAAVATLCDVHKPVTTPSQLFPRRCRSLIASHPPRARRLSCQKQWRRPDPKPGGASVLCVPQTGGGAGLASADGCRGCGGRVAVGGNDIAPLCRSRASAALSSSAANCMSFILSASTVCVCANRLARRARSLFSRADWKSMGCCAMADHLPPHGQQCRPCSEVAEGALSQKSVACKPHGQAALRSSGDRARRAPAADW